MDCILQSEAAECGLASIAMIAAHHGYKTDLNLLRQQYPQTLKGSNLQQLIGIADSLGMASRALKLDMELLPQLKLPCILHWDMNHFVVLTKVKRNSLVIMDPAVGKRELSLSEASKHFTGIAMELTPTAEFKKADERAQVKLSQFWQKITGIKPALLQLLGLSLILQLFALITPYYMQLVVDEVVVSYDDNLLLVLALGFGFVSLFNTLTTALRSYVVVHLSALLNIQLATNLFRHLLRLPCDYFEKRHMGDVLSRFSSLQQIKEMLTTGVVEAVIDGLMAITTLIMLFIYSPKLASIVFVAMIIYLMIRLIWYRPFRAVSEEYIVAGAKEQTNFMENIRGIQTIKLFSIESKRQAMWQNFYTDAINANVRIERLKVNYTVANNLLFGLENIIVVFLAAMAIMENSFTIGMLTAFMAYKSQLTQRYAALVERLIEFKMLGLHLNRLSDITLTEEEQHIEGTRQLQITGELKLSQITYQYSPNDPELFQDLSLSIPAGESIAIIGQSGCGKTTLMKIMLGLLLPARGSIEVGGVDIRHLGQRQYRNQIAAVMQSDELLSGSIADNISQFDPEIDLEKVAQVAQMAAIYDDISAMPMGFNSLVGDMGTTLSGGQKQRILLARALYKDPKILFLDEATSHLDIGAEQLVNHAVKSLDITRVIIAHRPETMRMADRILHLQDGQLIDVTQEIKQQKAAAVVTPQDAVIA
ncbi:peptidase domain-containing ABC transporter [Algicola sagamiensis]|uniref:peptidase domain-containing ABC transporter n=1 Tax=Algicola sagamiensis TaxID=163869 RepID=UPI00037B36D5|nr:peptidase domain-containing ABC transporter [Algicola sagamiensis]